MKVGLVPPIHLGLSAKLLLLTIAFVMIAEVLIFVPSVAKYRYDWLMERCLTAQVASLAAEAAPGHQISKTLRDELLKSARVRGVALRRTGRRVLILNEHMPPRVEAHYDLREASPWRLVRDAIAVLFSASNPPIRVIGQPRFSAGESIEIVLYQGPLRKAMLSFGLNILALSIIISVITAALVYFSLNGLLVRPMRRITRYMVHFRQDPEDTSRIIEPGNRVDEIGIAERELAAMQHELTGALRQKNHLAALGLAVSKISHDLRNMLASAQLISDRFGAIDDPTVQRFAPKLIASLDRAIRLCSDTLRYGKAEEVPPERSLFHLRPLVEEIGTSLGLLKPGRIEWRIEIDHALQADADRDQLYRVLSNLCRNALQVLQPLENPHGAVPHMIRVVAARNANKIVITISDTGPGLAEKAHENLFTAFKGSARKGGSGLGLAISAELVRAHGGTIEHVAVGPGATFRITIPDSESAIGGGA